MADILMYILNDDTENYPWPSLKSVVETFEHSTLYLNQPIKIQEKSPKLHVHNE